MFSMHTPDLLCIHLQVYSCSLFCWVNGIISSKEKEIGEYCSLKFCVTRISFILWLSFCWLSVQPMDRARDWGLCVRVFYGPGMETWYTSTYTHILLAWMKVNSPKRLEKCSLSKDSWRKISFTLCALHSKRRIFSPVGIKYCSFR